MNIPDREKALQDWASNVIKRWIKEMEVQQVSPHNPEWKGSGSLSRSFYYHVYNAAGGNQTKIVFTFNHYARYVDAGVSGGQPYDARKHLAPFRAGQRYQTRYGRLRSERLVKPFLMPVFRQRVYSLARILERRYAEYARIMFFRDSSPEDFGLPTAP
jgi:hypothetical protein